MEGLPLPEEPGECKLQIGWVEADALACEPAIRSGPRHVLAGRAQLPLAPLTLYGADLHAQRNQTPRKSLDKTWLWDEGTLGNLLLCSQKIQLCHDGLEAACRRTNLGSTKARAGPDGCVIATCMSA